MSVHTVIRWADWTIGPDTAPDVPAVTFAMHCTTCDAASGKDGDFETVRDWAFRHVGRHPSHTGYREVIHRHWRATLVR
ncbi:hypothetical protein BLA24_24340 [Streptomyces cinnamoneus]|uniref:DUF7848 domain-containing protein n=1 Tax=Streptomyces cinnamoneus TaxID=53446 RepID=A0A2G1XDF5_STRCJ|nr:hypothetical protein [Streptomyces cinnamoneus]PHQ49199.1 hypothetical protein BLA24_24340 [Streptomyces cinnamoneus]PPT15151.1 hypothetical protein CYQ11_21730 [Streptomyces cinnamoneus]